MATNRALITASSARAMKDTMPSKISADVCAAPTAHPVMVIANGMLCGPEFESCFGPPAPPHGQFGLRRTE